MKDRNIIKQELKLEELIFIFEEAKKKNDFYIDNSRHYDTKILAFLALSVALATYIFTTVNFKCSGYYIYSAISFFLSIIVFIYATYPKKHYLISNPITISDFIKKINQSDDELVFHYIENELIIKSKYRKIEINGFDKMVLINTKINNCKYICLIIGVSLLILGIILSIIPIYY